jgi:hydroxymethylpyrimidine/phosphomethylpyrimidine kinase
VPQSSLPAPRSPLPVALSIAGSDSGAGAGIQADLLTFAALGVFGTTAITCLTAQNPDSVSAVHAAPAELVADQIRQVLAHYPVKAAKTGMLFDAAIIESVTEALSARPNLPLVVDPVMVASSGAKLLRDDAMRTLREGLLSRATVITPNLDEAELLLGTRPREGSEGMERDAAGLARAFGAAVLLKGGHAKGDRLVDVLVDREGRLLASREAARVAGVDTHGSGCTLSAALTAGLAKGLTLADAFAAAHAYLQGGLAAPLVAGARPQIRH